MVPESTIARSDLKTARLVLRPSNEGDARRAFEILSDWEVSRMLRMRLFPPDSEDIVRWFRGHPEEWTKGMAHRFAILDQGRMVGLVDIDNIANREGVLGYWLDRAVWGQGYALEAASAAVAFAFQTLGLSKIRATHAADNEASGAVLRKLGFRRMGSEQRFSNSRREGITQIRYRLCNPYKC
jgi:[ribosomal protein S5]-alanine N-acetyltransferase